MLTISKPTYTENSVTIPAPPSNPLIFKLPFSFIIRVLSPTYTSNSLSISKFPHLVHYASYADNLHNLTDHPRKVAHNLYIPKQSLFPSIRHFKIPSCFNNHSFLHKPPAYPTSFPLFPITR